MHSHLRRSSTAGRVTRFVICRCPAKPRGDFVASGTDRGIRLEVPTATLDGPDGYSDPDRELGVRRLAAALQDAPEVMSRAFTDRKVCDLRMRGGPGHRSTPRGKTIEFDI